ncbi:hypothetical protein ACE1CD_03495 [Aerosakkonema sp. BLCC-F183]|uniref:hypothetical protein n=1 Tax=Aerosakkonema sp. BLCC-F183 TaxID=3342834 RepID=UPI0035B787AC
MIVAVQNQQTAYLHIEGDIPADLDEGAFISVTRKPALKIYSLGFQPAKSIPEIPRWFLHKYARKPFTVLDPFAGSGTTIIESLKYGASVYWLDYHPLSRLICRVKTSPVSPSEVLQSASAIIKTSENQKYAPNTVHFANKDFWFQQQVQEGLEIIREHIEETKITIQPVLWLAFASTVRKTSNINDGMLLAAKRSRFEEIPKRSRADVFRYFLQYVEKAVEAIAEWNPFLEESINNVEELPLADARTLSGEWLCDAIVTSPPYINAIDYVWAAKFELHWLGMVESDRERLDLYSKEIGTKRIPREECKALGVTGNQFLDSLIEDIYTGNNYKASKGQNELRARVVYKYFQDMKNHFASSFSHLRPGGYYCFSIGDISKICGVDIPVASILTELACEVGFCKQYHFNLLLKNRQLNLPRNVNWAGTIKHDTIVVLEKPA